MVNNKIEHNINDECLFCGEGPLYFVINKKNNEVFIKCEECDATWMDPSDLKKKDIIFPDTSEDKYMETDIFLKNICFASFEEIIIAGYKEYILKNN